MALVLKDRVRQTTTSTGASTITLSGSVAGYQSFSVIGTGNTTYYTIAGTSDWEVGIGTWTSPDQLSRDTILASTNGGAAVNFGAGTKDVFVTLPSERAVYTDAAGNLSAPPAIGGTTPNTIKGTTVTATTDIRLPGTGSSGEVFGWLRMFDNGDGYDYLTLSSYNNYSGEEGDLPIYCPGGLYTTNITFGDPYYGGLTIQAPASYTPYTLTLPTTAGLANQVLTSNGAGNVLSWTSVQKTITSGTAAPSGGSDGDIYLQYV